MNIKEIIDPMGLLNEPTSAEIKEWEESKLLSDNPYTLIGFLVYNRKQKLEQQLNTVIQND